ncbi:ATP-binding protein [Paenibacillus qinlingensis]|uniref:ATP-binding protein n=1 Tax=Paenibacillus qinlingensis TaxID=1837343 RepID=UPI0015645914|nr:ATP-binding protein [Paenibacillus qinlingensis]NQX62900.1 ATP-binding protein [Paenibacillus qinlingensis]
MKVHKIELPISSKLFWTMGNQNLTIGRAIAEFIDNSIDARMGTTKVIVELLEKEIIVTDNSCGMDLTSLVSALTPAESSKTSDLTVGGYGFGLKTASAFLGNSLEIITATNDMETALHVRLENNNGELSATDYSTVWEIEVMEVPKSFVQGTIIKITNLTRPRYKNDVENVKAHFSKTFSRFLQSEELELVIEDYRIKSYIFDPYWSEEFSFSVNNMSGQNCNVSGWVGVSKSPENSTTSKTDNGFHLYLNGRLLNYGIWIGLDRHPEMRLLVGVINLQNFKSNVTKTEIISDSQEYIMFEETFNEWLKKNNIRKLIDKHTKELIKSRKNSAGGPGVGAATGGPSVGTATGGPSVGTAVGGRPDVGDAGGPGVGAAGGPDIGTAGGPGVGAAGGPDIGTAGGPGVGAAGGPGVGAAGGPGVGAAGGPGVGAAGGPDVGVAGGPGVGAAGEPGVGVAGGPGVGAAAGGPSVTGQANPKKPPEIKLINGAENGTVVLNISSYFNAKDFVEARDYIGNLLPLTISHNSKAMDINKEGEYILIYTAIDNLSQKSNKELMFIIVDPNKVHSNQETKKYNVNVAAHYFRFSKQEFDSFHFPTGELSTKLQEVIRELNNLEFNENKIAVVSLFRILIELCSRKACIFYNITFNEKSGLSSNVHMILDRLRNKLPQNKVGDSKFQNDIPLNDKLAKEFNNFIKKDSIIDMLNLYMHTERRISDQVKDYWDGMKPYMVACLMLSS